MHVIVDLLTEQASRRGFLVASRMLAIIIFKIIIYRGIKALTVMVVEDCKNLKTLCII